MVFNFILIEILIFIIMLKIYSNCLSRFIDLYLKRIIREYALILIAVTLLSVTEISSYIVLQNLVSLTPQMHS